MAWRQPLGARAAVALADGRPWDRLDSEATPRIPSGGVPPTLATGSLSEAARTLAVALRCHVRDRRIGLNRDLYTGL